MIRLYDYELSGSCYKVRLLLHLLNLDYEVVPIDFVNGEHKGRAFLRINPFGEIPVLDDGDLRLRDAQAILVYLALQYDREHRWYPEDAASRGRIAQWLSTAGNELMSISAARLAKSFRYPFDLDRLHEAAHRVLRIIDAHLADRTYLELNRPTIADIACFPYAALAHEAGIDVSGYPHVVTWTARIRSLPGFESMPGVWAIRGTSQIRTASPE